MTKTKPFSFTSILLGFCFFFNPYFGAIDILPDFIGALLIALGLQPLARQRGDMRAAQRAFLYFAAINAVKQALMLFTFSIGTGSEQELLLLIVTFFGASIGVYFAIAAVRTFFFALESLAATYNVQELYVAKKGYRSRTERLERFTVGFFIVREVLCLLPELTVLLNTAYVDDPSLRLYNFIGLMRGMVFLPMLAVGIVWLCKLCRYFGRVKREKEFLHLLGEKYEAYMEAHPGIRIKSRFLFSFLLMGAGFVLLVDFYVDYKNIFSDTLAALLLFGGLLLLRLPQKRLLPTGGLALLYAIISAVSGRFAYAFSSEYVGRDIERSLAAEAAWQKMWIWALVEFAVFLALMVFVLLSLRDTVKREGGYLPEKSDLGFEKRQEALVHEEFDKRFISVYLFGFFSALLSFLFDYIKVWPHKRAFRIMEFFWFADFLFAVIFAIVISVLLAAIFAKIAERHQYE